MREISGKALGIFFALLGIALICACLSAWFITKEVSFFFFLSLVALLYLYAIAVYLLFLKVCRIPLGEIAPNSQEELTYHVYVCFYLILFYPLIRNHFIPTPLMRLLYLALGAKLGKNTYSAGVILDPPLTEVGDNTIIGHDAVLFSHAIEGQHLSHAKIVIGNNATIGAKSIIMSGVTVGDNAIVGAGAVVLKNTTIEDGEFWAGNPARKIR